MHQVLLSFHKMAENHHEEVLLSRTTLQAFWWR